MTINGSTTTCSYCHNLPLNDRVLKYDIVYYLKVLRGQVLTVDWNVLFQALNMVCSSLLMLENMTMSKVCRQTLESR